MALYLGIGIAVAIGAFLFFLGFDQTNRSQVVTARDQLRPSLTVRDRIDAMFQANEQWAANAATAKPGKLTLAEQISRADLKLRPSQGQLNRTGAAAILALVGFLRFESGRARTVGGGVGRARNPGALEGAAQPHASLRALARPQLRPVVRGAGL